MSVAMDYVNLLVWQDIKKLAEILGLPALPPPVPSEPEPYEDWYE